MARAADPVAERLYEEGRQAAEQKDWARACDRFEKSQEREPAPGTLLNLANCEENRGQFRSAGAHFEQAAQSFRPGDERIVYARQRAAAVEEKAAKLEAESREVAPPAGPAVAPAEAPAPVVVSPAPFATASTAPLAHDVPIADARPSGSASHGVLVAGWVGVGLGAAGLVLGSAGGLVTLGDKSTADSHCPAGCDATGLRAESNGKTWSSVSTASFIAGGAFAAAGISLLLLSPSRNTTVAAQASAGGAGLALRASF
ncbi:MAG TPA: hypothetical protein VIY73_09525 [Polyangiaceae bacterium]